MVKAIVDFKDLGMLEQLKLLMKRAKNIDKTFVTIGVHEDAGKYTEGNDPPTVVEVALWNEFGTRSIPERSFLRSAFNENEDKINAWRVEAIEKILAGTWTVEKGLEAIGFRVQQLIQNKIKSNVPPPNAPSTVEAKQKKGVLPKELPTDGATGTLIDTGLLLRSITYRVHTGDS